MSGLLTSYNLTKEIMSKGKISWTKKLSTRLIRLTPALLAVLLFYGYVWNNLGSGPMWNSLVKKNADICKDFMWRNLFYVQNFFPFEIYAQDTYVERKGKVGVWGGECFLPVSEKNFSFEVVHPVF